MNYAEAGIPAKVQRRTWKDLDPIKPLDTVRDWADGYPESWTGETAELTAIGRGLLLHGDAGSGKSTAAGMALKAVIDHSHAGWFVPMPTLEAHLHRQMDLGTYVRKVDALDPETQELFEATVQRMTKIRMKYWVVVIDDWGRERMASSFLQDYVEGLLRERFNRGLPTIITTNLTRKEIVSTLPRQFASFLGESMLWVDFGSRDFRGAR